MTKLFAPNLIGRRTADTGHSKFRLVNFRWRPLGPCGRRTSSFYCLLMARPKVHFLAPGLILEDFAPRPSKQADSVVHIHIVRPMFTYCLSRQPGKCLLIGQKVRTLLDKLSPCHCHNLSVIRLCFCHWHYLHLPDHHPSWSA